MPHAACLAMPCISLHAHEMEKCADVMLCSMFMASMGDVSAGQPLGEQGLRSLARARARRERVAPARRGRSAAAWAARMARVSSEIELFHSLIQYRMTRIRN